MVSTSVGVVKMGIFFNNSKSFKTKLVLNKTSFNKNIGFLNKNSFNKNSLTSLNKISFKTKIVLK